MCGNASERAAVSLGISLREQVGQCVARHSRDIFHHCDGILEYVMIDSLVNESYHMASLIVGGAVGVIDVPRTVVMRFDKVGTHLK